MYIKFNVWKYLLLGLLMTSMLSSVRAQGVTVRGKVIDEDNLPLPGVSVKLKNAASGTSTDQGGNFSISVPNASGAVLTFSFLGYETREQALQTGLLTYTIRMQSSVSSLNEVVVVGYGEVRKKDLTGAVGSVNVQDLQRAPVASFDQALAGRVAGVQVSSSDGQPGGGMNIVVRGSNSITQSNSPLYVVDGFPIETDINSSLNPSDIESIEVLKDASATAIYGARGANGVVIVTTKRGKSGEPAVSYQGFLGSQEVIKRIDVMNPYEFVKYQLEQDPAMYTPVYLSNGKTLESYRNVEGVDWQDKMFQTAMIQNHSLSLTGGTDKTRYSITGAMLDQDGVILNGGYNRYVGRFAFDQEISRKAKFGLNLNYSSAKAFGTRVGEATGSPTSTLMYSIWGYRPVTGRPDDTGLEYEPYDPDVNPATDLRFNPVITATNTFNPQLTNTLFSNAFIEYSILKDLKLRVTGGLTRTHINNQRFNNSNTQSGNPISSVNGVNGSISNSFRNNFLNENTLTYTPSIGKDHRLSVLGGFTNQEVRFESSGYTAIQIPNEVLGMSGIDEGIVTGRSSNRSVNTLASFLGRVNYSYKDKYLLTASFRSDGSSKFSEGNKWSYFPSGSIAWRISEEPFMKSVSFISDAKLRGGFGMTGNNRVSDFAYLSSYQIVDDAGYSFNNSPLQGIVPNQLGTRDLTWETTAQTDIGLDISFLNDRINFTTDYYKKVTSDLLLNASLAPSMGYLTGFKNVGEVQNSGWEFSLSTRNITTDKFSWTSNFNISFNKNRVNKLSDDQPDLQSRITWGNFSSTPYIAIPGAPIAQFNGYVFDGIYQFSDFDQQSNGTYVLKADVPNNGLPRAQIQPGFVKYKDINGDGIVDAEDITTIGNPNPKHVGGFTNNFRYGGFDLNVFFQWSYGNDLMNVNRIVFEGGEPRNYLNQYASFANRWTPENPSNTLYKVGGQGPLVYSSRIIEDGSYLRLKTLALGYNLPGELLSRAKVRNMRVYVSAQNLLTWTNYSGVDPEVSVRHSALTPGFDLSAYPQTRTFTFGFNLTL